LRLTIATPITIPVNVIPKDVWITVQDIDDLEKRSFDGEMSAS